jgi:hypothetical protein
MFFSSLFQMTLEAEGLTCESELLFQWIADRMKRNAPAAVFAITATERGAVGFSRH